MFINDMKERYPVEEHLHGCDGDVDPTTPVRGGPDEGDDSGSDSDSDSDSESADDDKKTPSRKSTDDEKSANKNSKNSSKKSKNSEATLSASPAESADDDEKAPPEMWDRLRPCPVRRKCTPDNGPRPTAQEVKQAYVVRDATQGLAVVLKFTPLDVRERVLLPELVQGTKAAVLATPPDKRVWRREGLVRQAELPSQEFEEGFNP